ncbi:MAG: GNAT family N-acetyltransferase [Anaerolineales bacterium]|nr:GNAT family N-acetyltransferase [Anaerolineales bacterium]
MDYRITPANTEHLPGIYALVEKNVQRQALLPRSRESIAASLQDWVVAVNGEDVIGCGSLLDYRDGLVEIRSLAIADAHHGNGIGTGIINLLIDNARSKGQTTVFALTTAVSLFQKCDFSIVSRNCFPDKVIRFCEVCPKRHACDETAVVFQLVDAPFHCQNERCYSAANLTFSVLSRQAGLIR